MVSVLQRTQHRNLIEYRFNYQYWEHTATDSIRNKLKLLQVEFNRLSLFLFDVNSLYLLTTDTAKLKMVSTILNNFSIEDRKFFFRWRVLYDSCNALSVCLKYLTVFSKSDILYKEVLQFTKKHLIPLYLNSHEIQYKDIIRLEKIINLDILTVKFDFKRFRVAHNYFVHIYFLTRLTKHKEEIKCLVTELVVRGIGFNQYTDLYCLLFASDFIDIPKLDIEKRLPKYAIQALIDKSANKMTDYQIKRLQAIKHLLYTDKTLDSRIFKGSEQMKSLEFFIRVLLIKIHT